MIRQKKMQNFLTVIFPSLILVICSAEALAGTIGKEKDSSPFIAADFGLETVHWEKGQFVNLCNANDGKCQTVKMPKTLGKVERVREGSFISSARASWLAFTKFETFVCAALRMRTTVVCARIDSDAFPTDTVDVGVEITNENKTRISIIARKEGADTHKLAKLGASFKQGVWQSVNVLQGEVDAVAAGMSSFTSSLSICDKDPRYPGPAPHPDCTMVEEGGTYMWSCPVSGTPPGDPTAPTWPALEPVDPNPCA